MTFKIVEKKNSWLVCKTDYSRYPAAIGFASFKTEAEAKTFISAEARKADAQVFEMIAEAIANGEL